MPRRIYSASFTSIYPRYAVEREKNGRTKAQVEGHLLADGT